MKKVIIYDNYEKTAKSKERRESLMRQPENKETGLILLGIFIVGFFLFFTNNFYKSVWKKSGLEEAEEIRNYDMQYEMIVGSGKSEFWQTVYDSALEEAEKHDAYVEFHASDMKTGYDETDYMEISIAAGVDGIILEYNGEEELKKEIDKAEDAGIPVITIMSDAPDSKRQSFVGVNDYQMGQAYGEQIAQFLDENIKSILLLLDSEKGDLEKNQLYSQISNAVMKKSSTGEIEVKAEMLTPESKFDIEEAIRMIFQAPEGPPQILVCMDEITTECAYQAMIDFNMVGEVKIIGYYISETIRGAVKKGLIPVTCTLDAEGMGQDCVDAMWELKQEGRVNSYYNAELKFLGKEDIDKADPSKAVKERE